MSATDGAPYLYQEFDTPKGPAFTFIAAVPEEFERETILRLSANDPKNIHLAVNGPEDPGFKAALESGNLAWINTYRVGNIEQSSVMRDEADVGLKNKVRAKLNQMAANVKAKKWGVMMAFGYAGVVSLGSVYYQTASVTNSIGTFAVTGLVAAFVVSQSKDWVKFLNKSGDAQSSLVGRVMGAFGLKLDDANKAAFKKAGMFATTLAVSAAQAKFVTWMSNEHLEYAHLMMLAFATNYAVWDLTVSRLVEQHKIKHHWEDRYFFGQIVVGALAELAVYAHVENVEAGLGVVVAGGLGYLMGGEHIESAASLAKASVRYKIDAAKGRVIATTSAATERARASAERAYASTKGSCAGLFGKFVRVAQAVGR